MCGGTGCGSPRPARGRPSPASACPWTTMSGRALGDEARSAAAPFSGVSRARIRRALTSVPARRRSMAESSTTRTVTMRGSPGRRAANRRRGEGGGEHGPILRCPGRRGSIEFRTAPGPLRCEAGSAPLRGRGPLRCEAGVRSAARPGVRSAGRLRATPPPAPGNRRLPRGRAGGGVPRAHGCGHDLIVTRAVISRNSCDAT